jgi:hypothetical protein
VTTHWCNCQSVPGTDNYPGPWHPRGDAPHYPCSQEVDATPADPVALLREAARLLRDPSYSTTAPDMGRADIRVPPWLREPLAAWLHVEAKRINRRHPVNKEPALDIARVIIATGKAT